MHVITYNVLVTDYRHIQVMISKLKKKRLCFIQGTLLFNCSVVFDYLQPCGLQQARLPCPSLSPRVCSNSCPLSQWCHPIISSSVVPFSSCPQSFPASGSFPMSQFFASGGQSIGASVSASVLPTNTDGWFLSGLTSKTLKSTLRPDPWMHPYPHPT